jgi:hypothetical protein
MPNYRENWAYKRKLRIIKQHNNPLEIVFNIEKIELNNPQNMPFSR